MKTFLDFDGTMVLHRYPDIGEEVPDAVQTVKELIAAGHEVILNTYRVEIGLAELYAAINWLKERGIKLGFYTQHKYPPAFFGKFGQDYFIDDHPSDAPLLESGAVDWSVVREHFRLKQIEK
jgi:hypothetical protein